MEVLVFFQIESTEFSISVGIFRYEQNSGVFYDTQNVSF